MKLLLIFFVLLVVTLSNKQVQKHEKIFSHYLQERNLASCTSNQAKFKGDCYDCPNSGSCQDCKIYCKLDSEIIDEEEDSNCSKGDVGNFTVFCSDLCDNAAINFRQQDIDQNCPCLSGYLSINQNLKCEKCHSKCQECEISTDQCKQCSNSNTQNRQLLDQNCDCIENYFEDPISFECKECNVQCQNCQSQNICLECKGLNRLQMNNIMQNKQCTVCDQGYFHINNQIDCLKCEFPCNQCQNQQTCTTCIQEKLMDINQNCACIQGYILNKQQNLCILQNNDGENQQDQPSSEVIGKQKDLDQVLDHQPVITIQAQNIISASQATKDTVVYMSLPLAMTGNVSFILNIIDFTQLISLYATLNYNMSSELRGLFVALFKFEFPLVPNFFEFFIEKENFDEEFQSDKLPKQLQEIKITPYFIQNAGQFISLVLIMLTLQLFLTVLYSVLNKYNKFPTIKLVALVLIIKMKWNAYIILLKIKYTNLIFAVFAQFYYLDSQDISEQMNLGIWVILGFLLIIYPFTILYQIFRYSKQRTEKFRERYNLFWINMKIFNFWQLSFNIILYIRKLVFCLIMVALHYQFEFQMKLLIIINILIFFYTLLIRPYQQNKNFVIFLISESCLTLLQFVFLIHDDMQDDDDSFITESMNVLYLVLGVIIINGISVMYDMIVYIIQYFKHQNKKKLKQRRQGKISTFLVNQLMNFEEYMVKYEQKHMKQENKANKINNKDSKYLQDSKKKQEALQIINPTSPISSQGNFNLVNFHSNNNEDDINSQQINFEIINSKIHFDDINDNKNVQHIEQSQNTLLESKQELKTKTINIIGNNDDNTQKNKIIKQQRKSNKNMNNFQIEELKPDSKDSNANTNNNSLQMLQSQTKSSPSPKAEEDKFKTINFDNSNSYYIRKISNQIDHAIQADRILEMQNEYKQMMEKQKTLDEQSDFDLQQKRQSILSNKLLDIENDENRIFEKQQELNEKYKNKSHKTRSQRRKASKQKFKKPFQIDVNGQIEQLSLYVINDANTDQERSSINSKTSIKFQERKKSNLYKIHPSNNFLDSQQQI